MQHFLCDFIGAVLSLLLGYFAILCRQTNAVWLLFFVVEAALKQLRASERTMGPSTLISEGVRNLKTLLIAQVGTYTHAPGGLENKYRMSDTGCVQDWSVR